jgi:CrcB protein
VIATEQGVRRTATWFVLRSVKLQMQMQRLIYMGLAGGVGTLMRYWLAEWTARRFGETFPTGTLVVNLLGCFLAGLLFYLMLDRYLVSPTVRTVVLIGLLGGFTTFSAFGLQTFTLLREGEMGLALFNIAISNIGGLLLVWVGYSYEWSQSVLPAP